MQIAIQEAPRAQMRHVNYCRVTRHGYNLNLKDSAVCHSHTEITQTAEVEATKPANLACLLIIYLMVTNLFVPCLAQKIFKSIELLRLYPSPASFSSTFLNAP